MTLVDLLVLLGAAVAIAGVNLYFFGFGGGGGEDARGEDARGKAPRDGRAGGGEWERSP